MKVQIINQTRYTDVSSPQGVPLIIYITGSPDFIVGCRSWIRMGSTARSRLTIGFQNSIQVRISPDRRSMEIKCISTTAKSDSQRKQIVSSAVAIVREMRSIKRLFDSHNGYQPPFTTTLY